jgi:hypothetical protein
MAKDKWGTDGTETFGRSARNDVFLCEGSGVGLVASSNGTEKDNADALS